MGGIVKSEADADVMRAMNFRRLPVLLGVLAAAWVVSGCRTASVPRVEVEEAVVGVVDETVSAGSLDDTARYLAGLPGPGASPYAMGRQTTHWVSHRRRMEELWRYFSAYRQPRIAQFCASELGRGRESGTVWYPFSGPDILFADSFFPGAGSFVLSGLEGCDLLPDPGVLTPEEMAAGLDGIEESMTTALSCSFFITKDMRVDLQKTRFRGTLPVVLVFLARMGGRLESVEPVSIDGAGNLEVGRAEGSCPGYAIRARTGGREVTIYYFRANLADEVLRGDGRFLAFVGRFGPVSTYLKSASYLMHTDEFTMVREAILGQSRVILQDDSGIPLRAFAGGPWEMRYFGRYTGVLEIFSEYYQPELTGIFASGGARDIDFGIGYKHQQGESCLMLARRR